MNRIDKKFKALKAEGKKAFIAYITAGDPDIKATGRLVKVLEASGADIIELGIPFSDPIADGPTIQAASYRALQKKASLKKIFAMMAGIRKNTDIPIAFMTYYNPVFKYGVERFFKSCKSYGVDGLIVPDLPYEEASGLIRLGRKYGIATIFLVAPTTTRRRMKNITGASSGFVYYVSLSGVTGARSRLPVELASRIKLVKSFTKKPVAVGFGISNPAQAADIAKVSDGVIVGSAIVRIIGERKNIYGRVSGFTGRIAEAIHGVRRS